MSCCKRVAARSSPLSKAQVQEVLQALQKYDSHLKFEVTWVKTTGDCDKKTSLRLLEKTDFFTKQIDELLLSCQVDLAIHSAKDLPEPLNAGLIVAAITAGIDPSDALVFRQGESLQSLPLQAKVGTSSARRDLMVYGVRSDLQCVDIRGTIEERLALLDEKIVDAVVIAEAALIRLNLTCRNRMLLPQQTLPMQGKLACVCRKADKEMRSLCGLIDARSCI